MVLPWRITSLSQNLSKLAYKQARIAQLLKRLEDAKKELRQELFEVADDSYEGKDYLVPVTSIYVPIEFFEKTGMSYEDFVATRYPAWELVSKSGDFDIKVLILRKKTEYMPWEYEDDEVSVARSISEATPDIDWDSMQLVDPDLFDRLAIPVTKYELNESVLQGAINEDKSIVTRLRLYTVSKKPVQRVLAKFKDGRR